MSTSSRITILLADEDALRRDGLAAVLSSSPEFEVVAGVASGESALDRIRGLRPDIAVVDLNLPEVHGIELVRRVRSEAIATRILILAGTSDEDVIREAVRAGSDGYVLKNSPARHLVDAISYVRDGGKYFSPQLRREAGREDSFILDRLGEIDNRVARIERLDTQLAGADVEARLPGLIEEEVTKRFHRMAGKLQAQIEETHVRTLETCVRNIQAKLVQRVSALEQDMAGQASAMNDLREYSQRTEDNLTRLIVGVDRLAQDLPKRLAAPSPEDAADPEPVAEPVRRRGTSNRKRLAMLARIVIAGVVLSAIVFWGVRRARKSGFRTVSEASAPGASLAPESGKSATQTKLQAAQEYSDRKEYAAAEDLYRQVIRSEPANAEALQALASVLFREDKIDESAAILDKLPHN